MCQLLAFRDLTSLNQCNPRRADCPREIELMERACCWSQGWEISPQEYLGLEWSPVELMSDLVGTFGIGLYSPPLTHRVAEAWKKWGFQGHLKYFHRPFWGSALCPALYWVLGIVRCFRHLCTQSIRQLLSGTVGTQIPWFKSQCIFQNNNYHSNNS